MEVLIPKPGSWYIKESTGNSVGQINGPFHDSGDPWDVINFTPSELNQFVQGIKIADQSSVFHQKVDGKIYVIPELRNSVRNGTLQPAGLPLYNLRIWGTSSGWQTLTTTLDKLLTQQESYGYALNFGKEQFCAYSYRPDFRTSITASANNSTSGEDRWSAHLQAVKIVSVSANMFRYASWPYYGEPDSKSAVGLYSGGGTTMDGLALARQLATSVKTPPPPLDTYLGEKWFLQKGNELSLSEVKTWISSIINPSLLTSMPSANLDDWGDLAHEAAGNLDANSANMIAFIKDLRKVKDLMPKLKALGKLKTHAGNYLGVQYGVLPTIGDLQSIFEAFKVTKYYDRSGYRRVSAYVIDVSKFDYRGKSVPITHTRRLHLAVNENDTGLDSLTEKARSIGVFPSLVNIWDLVPYSFVLDWFVDVGSVLDRIDTLHRLINLDIPYVMKSDKSETFISFFDDKVGVGASLSLTRYNREVTRTVPQPRIFGEINKPPSVQNRWIEGSALILTRTK